MPVARLDPANQRFLNPDGQPFFALGVNYEGYFDRAWQLWEEGKFDLELIERDFKKMAEAGFNCLRLFVQNTLAAEIQQANFTKLDLVLQLAYRYNLLVVLALNDMHWLDLTRIGTLDARIATRYRGAPMILGWDLENEPVFYNLVAAIYPPGDEVPVRTSLLVDHYGERATRAEAAGLQQQRRIPGHLDADQAYYYINALRLFLDYSRAASSWTSQNQSTLLDYMLAPEAARWHTLIGALDETVAAWIATRAGPVRESDPTHPISIGWSWPQFAGLPANRALDFQQYHEYVPLSVAGFQDATRTLAGLRRHFPEHPILLGEFGWSNHSSRDPAVSKPVDEQSTALFEGALLSFLRAEGFAGGLKWMLNDVDTEANPYEAGFGVFRKGDVPKTIRNVMQRFSRDWSQQHERGSFNLARDAERIAYRLTLPGQVIVGGSTYQDQALAWRTQEQRIAHCFIKQDGLALKVDADGAGRLALDPGQVIAGWDSSREVDLYRLYGDRRSRQQTFPPGTALSWDLAAGAWYELVPGAVVSAPPAEGDTLVPEPQPGEHVLLLASADNFLEAAFEYIRRFRPDLSFAPAEVPGRWAYVTVVAQEEEIPASLLEEIRGTGALRVERIVADTPAATKAILDAMAVNHRRFLSDTAPELPEEPPTGPDEPPPPEPPPPETYVVQTGDTLSAIARMVYGQASLWPMIFDANRDILDSPGRIRPGMVLKIPPRL